MLYVGVDGNYTANAVWSSDACSWRLKPNKQWELLMSNGKLFQTETAECLKSRDAVTVHDRVTYNNFWSEDCSVFRPLL